VSGLVAQVQRLVSGIVRRLGGVPVGEVRAAEAEIARLRARLDELEAQRARATKTAPEVVQADRPKRPAGEPRKTREQHCTRTRETLMRGRSRG
jgi:type II secretory pathway component PulM